MIEKEFELNGLKFDLEQLERVHSTPEGEFMPIVQEIYPHAQFIEIPDKRQLIHVDNGKDIMAVAHLDGTMPAKYFGVGYQYYPSGKEGHGYRRNFDFGERIYRDAKPDDELVEGQEPIKYGEIRSPIIFSPYVDDRLGAYTLLHLLPQIGVECDFLFSVGEEQGRPTSEYFEPARDYKWMFMFDRRGTDAVIYQYYMTNWIEALYPHFGRLERGSFSDISRLSHFGCCGVNIGTGYYDYTDWSAWASLGDLSGQVRKLEAFYNEHKETEFEWAGRPDYHVQQPSKKNTPERGGRIARIDAPGINLGRLPQTATGVNPCDFGTVRVFEPFADLEYNDGDCEPGEDPITVRVV